MQQAIYIGTSNTKEDPAERLANFQIGKDEVCGLPYLHLAYVIHSFIPRRFIENQSATKTSTVFGTFAEGTRLPAFVHMKEDGYFAKRKFSKVPPAIFYHSKDVKLAFPSNIEADEYNYVISTENVHAGFCRLKVLQNGNNETHTDLQVDKKGILYLSSSKSKRKFQDKISSNKKAIEAMLDTLINRGDGNSFDMKFSDVFTGVPDNSLDLNKRPHTTMGLRGLLISAKQKTDRKAVERESGLIYEIDADEVGHSLAFGCKQWPPGAMEWKTRKRFYNWPGEGTIQKVEHVGFHIIPVSHPCTTAADIEWQMSFAAAEKQIMIEEVDDSQRQCFMFFNLLCAHAIADSTIQPNHLKSIFFYVCEEIDPKIWYNNPAYCSFLMLDRLIDAVRNKSLPCYFLCKNNMFDHLSDVQSSQLERRLTLIRKKPLQELFSLADNYTILDVFPYNLDVKKLFNPVLSNARSYTDETQAGKAVEIFIQTSNGVSNGFYHEYGFDHCACIVDDVVDYFVEPILGHDDAQRQREQIPHILNQRNIEFSNYLSPLEIWKPITFGRYLIARYVEGKRGSGLFEHLACLYHAAANIFTERRIDLLREADVMFQEALNREGEGNGPGLILEYAHFLCSCQKYTEAVPHLMNVISTERDNPTSMNYYGKMEAFVVDNFVQQEIEMRGFLEVLSIVYAYYLLINCYVCLKKQTLIDTLVDEYEQLVETVNDSVAFSLFGYAMKKSGDYRRAGNAFKKSVDLEPKNKLAKGNLASSKRHSPPTESKTNNGTKEVGGSSPEDSKIGSEGKKVGGSSPEDSNTGSGGKKVDGSPPVDSKFGNGAKKVGGSPPVDSKTGNGRKKANGTKKRNGIDKSK